MRVVLISVLAVLVLACSGAADGRGELVLAWEDEGAPRIIYPVPVEGREIAVMFQSPEGFDSLRAILCYVGNDNQLNRDAECTPPTQPFTLSVWGPEDSGRTLIPAEPSVYEYSSGAGYPEDLWIQFNLPESVDLNDTATFPDRVFFVGVKWITMGSLALGVDWEPIVSGHTWQKFISTGWALYPEPGNCACVRALVSDDSGSAVELLSWGQVKSCYRSQ